MGTLAHPYSHLEDRQGGTFEVVVPTKRTIRIRQYAKQSAALRFCEKHDSEALRHSGRFVVNEIDGGAYEVELLVPAELQEIDLTWLFD